MRQRKKAQTFSDGDDEEADYEGLNAKTPAKPKPDSIGHRFTRGAGYGWDA